MYKWNILGEATDGKNAIDRVLENRGFDSPEQREIFLNPPSLGYWFKLLPHEFLDSLKIARDQITKAISTGAPIIVHGDYDVDGVCAAAILFSTIKTELNYDNVSTFIPNRFTHGYGLSKGSIDAALALVDSDDTALFITVDSGITAVAAADYIKGLGHDIIITDHHQKPEILPQADIILWNDSIVGSSIAWLLAKTLGAKDETYLAYACLATVTDLQPLVGFNRSIVKFGLESINQKLPLAFDELLKLGGKKGNDVNTYDLGWLIGPRLNASGRVDDASKSLNLLIEKDLEVVKTLAWDLNKINSERQDKTEEMYGLASELGGKKLPKIIISQDQNYHEGIIGLVASKIVQKYNRPAIVIGTGNNLAKGSVRSIPSINIIEVLRKFDYLFDNLGGHPMAAGFSILSENIPVLEEKLMEYAEQNITDDMLVKVINIDLAIPLEIIDLNFLESLKGLKPFGIGNDEPVFASKNVGVASVNTFGRENNHLAVRLLGANNTFKGILFNHGDLLQQFEVGSKVDIVYTVKENIYNGNAYIDIVIKDFKSTQ